MPFYEVYHSYPFTDVQRQALATSITELHCAAFTTPSLFVHVRFIKHDATDGTYFMAGKPRVINTNRIISLVRTSPSRPKSAFDALAADIEKAWYEALKAPNGGPNDQSSDSEAMRLLLVIFTPMVSIRENGMTIPEAGNEGPWLKENLLAFREMADSRGLTDFGDLLQELEEREDLKKLLQ